MNSGIQFINGYKWVDTYYNGVKIAGSQLVEVSGEMLSVPNTYDDSAWLKIYGNTQEIGEGDKSPDNPYELKSVGDDGGFDLVSVGNAGQLQTINFPYTLRSLPDGTRDYIEIDDVVKKAIYQPLTNEYTFNGTENWIKDNPAYDTSNTLGFYVNVPGMLRTTDGSKTYIRCDKFNVIPYTNWLTANVMCCSSLYRSLNVKVLKSELPTQDLAGFKAWLGDNPITIIYRLADPPEPIELDYNAVKTYYPYTQIYTTATVQPTIEGKIRVWTA